MLEHEILTGVIQFAGGIVSQLEAARQSRENYKRDLEEANRAYSRMREECGNLRAAQQESERTFKAQLAAAERDAADWKARAEAMAKVVLRAETALAEEKREHEATRMRAAELEAQLDNAQAQLAQADPELAAGMLGLTEQAESRLETALGLLREIVNNGLAAYSRGYDSMPFAQKVREFLAECEPQAEPAPQPADPLAGVDKKAFSEFCERQAAGFPEPQATPPLVEFPPEPEGEFRSGRRIAKSWCNRWCIWRDLGNGMYHFGTVASQIALNKEPLSTYALAVAACNEHARQKGAGA